MKFLAMHITNQKWSFDIYTLGWHDLYFNDFWHKRKINNFDPYNVLLAIATNICAPASHKVAVKEMCDSCVKYSAYICHPITGILYDTYPLSEETWHTHQFNFIKVGKQLHWNHLGWCLPSTLSKGFLITLNCVVRVTLTDCWSPAVCSHTVISLPGVSCWKAHIMTSTKCSKWVAQFLTLSFQLNPYHCAVMMRNLLFCFAQETQVPYLLEAGFKKEKISTTLMDISPPSECKYYSFNKMITPTIVKE